MIPVALRAAIPFDADAAVDLILAPPGGLNTIFPDRRVAARVTRAAFLSERTALSFRRSLVAEDRGIVAGMIVRFPGWEWPVLRVPTGLVMVRAAGVRPGLALVRRGRAEDRATAPVPGDALFVMSLAVRRDRRSRGIGATLLSRAAEEARMLGMARLALDVLAGNEGAIRFYEREGFAEVSRRDVPGRRGEPVRAVRMERAL